MTTREDYIIHAHPDNRLSDPSSVWQSNQEPVFCVEHVPSGDNSQYYSHDMCEEIIRLAIKGELAGTFGLGTIADK